MSLINSLKWRYATKSYDVHKKVAEADVEQILEAVRLGPSSSGLQQYRVLVVKNQEIKERMVDYCYGQEIVAECSHVLVFAAWENYTAELIDEVYQKTATIRGLPKERYTAYTERLKKIFLNRTAQENLEHAARQTYIGLGLAIAEAAELKIDATPMEGFENEQIDKLLGLDKYNLKSVTLLPIGYRNEEKDWMANMAKFREKMADFVIRID